MDQKWIVLIGAPAAGKSTLAKRIRSELTRDGVNCEIISFDELFPLETLKSSEESSKHFRAEMIEMAKSSDAEWIIFDDTCHLYSMQKQYIKTATSLVFFHLETKMSDIVELSERNALRESFVTTSDIEKIVTLLCEDPPAYCYCSVRFPYNEIPEGNIMPYLMERVQPPRYPSKFIGFPDEISNSNARNRLNIILNSRIHRYLSSGRSRLNGLQISKLKKQLMTQLNQIEIDQIENLASIFEKTHLSP